MRTRFILLIVGLIATASSAGAQVIQPPPRSTGGLFGGRRPVDPNRTSQELTLAMHILGGYDDAIASGSIGVPGATGEAPLELSGYATTASGVLRYWRGRTTRSFEASGRAFITSYAVPEINPLVGGDVDLRATTRLGRKNRLVANVGIHDQPRFLMSNVGSAEPLQPGAPADYSATLGATEQSWLSGSASLALEREWSVRHRSTLQGSFFSLNPTNGPGFESQDLATSLRHRWNFRRNGGLNFSYRYSDRLTVDEDNSVELPVQSQTAELGLTVQKRWSGTRRLEISGGGGAVRAQSPGSAGEEPFVFVTPSMFGTVRLDLFRTWAFSADMRRDVNILHGLTPQSFITESASLSTGGRIGRRVDLTMSANFSRGVASQGDFGRFESLAAAGQLRWALSNWVEFLMSYNYYSHLILDVTRLPSSYPARFDRNSIRFGLTIMLPLYGGFQTN